MCLCKCYLPQSMNAVPVAVRKSNSDWIRIQSEGDSMQVTTNGFPPLILLAVS